MAVFRKKGIIKTNSKDGNTGKRENEERIPLKDAFIVMR